MAKININFNDKKYSIDESSLSAPADSLKSHLSTVMNGSGATINFGGTDYGVDSTKLSTARNDFTTHLGTISGNGKKIVIGGVEYSIGSDKVAVAIGELEAVLGGLNSGSDSGETYTAGLYQTGAIALYEEQGAEAIEGMMIKSWDELVAEGVISVDNGVVYTPFDVNKWANASSDVLAGDLMLPNDESVTILGDVSTSDYGGMVGRFPFTGCVGLTGIMLPNCVTSICEGAFAGCANLTSVTIPDGVTIIKEGAFSDCVSLTNFDIPNSVTIIEPVAFWLCKRLVNITFEGTIAQWNAITKGHDWNVEVPATKVVCSDGEVSLA